MANGRLGSAKINPVNAALLYSNTSGSQAVINIQATGLSSTTNANLALAVDSATVTLNQVTVDEAIPSGSITQSIYWLDPISSTRPLQFDRVNVTTSSNGDQYPVSYWNGSAWFKPTTGFYGAPNWQKIDPYFISTPSAYGKASGFTPVAIRYNTSDDNLRFRNTNVTAMTGTQFATMQQFGDSGATYTGTTDQTYGGFGFGADLYTDWVITTGNNGYMGVFKLGSSLSASGNASTNSTMYNVANVGNNSLNQLAHYWYAPRIMGSNGLFVVQGTGYSQSYFCLSDPDFALALGNSNYAITWNGTATAGWWYVSADATSVNQIGWFEYNPNDGRYYLEQVATNSRRILSFTRAALNAFPTRGNAGGPSLNTSTIFTNHGAAPWGTNYAMRPIRVGASLWWTVASNNVAYVSTDLKTWTVATTYYPANSYPANTFIVTPTTSTSYLYAQASTANISKLTSGFASVSDTAVLEYNTSISNYQRTGIVLSNGDKLYAQNYGSVPISATVMGYEG